MLIKRDETLPVFSNFFGDFFDKAFSDWKNSNFSLTNTTLPAVNIKETKDDFVVTMAVPGMTDTFQNPIHFYMPQQPPWPG